MDRSEPKSWYDIVVIIQYVRHSTEKNAVLLFGVAEPTNAFLAFLCTSIAVLLILLHRKWKAHNETKYVVFSLIFTAMIIMMAMDNSSSIVVVYVAVKSIVSVFSGRRPDGTNPPGIENQPRTERRIDSSSANDEALIE